MFDLLQAWLTFISTYPENCTHDQQALTSALKLFSSPQQPIIYYKRQSELAKNLQTLAYMSLGWLHHLSRIPHLPEVPHLQVNRPSVVLSRLKVENSTCLQLIRTAEAPSPQEATAFWSKFLTTQCDQLLIFFSF